MILLCYEERLVIDRLSQIMQNKLQNAFKLIKNFQVVTKYPFAELKTLLDDIPRARAIYELAISQPRLDMPELLWKSYIDFEIAQDETENARQLFKNLLKRTLHVKVWIAIIDFVFPEDESQRQNLKILASAKAWIKQKELGKTHILSSNRMQCISNKNQ